VDSKAELEPDLERDGHCYLIGDASDEAVLREAGILVRERLRLIPHEQKREHLLTLTGLIEAGKLTRVLDRTYPLAGTAEGLRHVEQGHARGKIVITVA
jgi:NADPH:quinone reductase-like Zn-dependent oxidoreductase